jgi:NAD+ synthase
VKTEAEKLLHIDAPAEVDRICSAIREIVPKRLKRQGVVVAISGGIDSSVTAAICVRALGPDRVIALMMPERDSSDDTARLSRELAEFLGVRVEYEKITSVLESVGCYRRRDEAIRRAIPEYTDGWKAKIVLPSVTDSDTIRYYSVVAISPDGNEVKKRLPVDAYLQVVAATNFKQRVRKMFEYYYADVHNYAVTGTPNRLEYDQGFFVKLGDGAADIKPIAHLYKSQVYRIGNFLKLPAEIINRPPTTDTYSMPQSQEEFYFSLPYGEMDVCLYGKNNGMSAAQVGELVGYASEQIERVYRDIEQKRRTTEYLHLSSQLTGDIPELTIGNFRTRDKALKGDNSI